MNKILFLFLLFATAASAQERILLEGEVTEQGEGIENVHIRNVTNRHFSISNQDGQFYISTAVGDTLLFTHITMRDLVKVISRAELRSGLISIDMLPRDHELEEVVLENNLEISALSLGIISEKREIPTTYERRLQTAGDFKWYHLFGLLGGGLEIDPILNAINGRTKKLKRNIQIERKIENIKFLNENYLDYMTENFEVTEAGIQRFWDYLMEQEDLTAAIDAGNEDRLKFYLTDQWFRYNERLEEE